MSAPRSRVLRAAVIEGLAGHGIAALATDEPEPLRERLNDLYLDDVRALRARQRAGEIALADYAGQVDALRRRYPLLGLPLPLWRE